MGLCGREEEVDFGVGGGVRVGTDAANGGCPRFYWADDWVVCGVHSDGFVSLVVFLVFKGDTDVVRGVEVGRGVGNFSS